MIDLSDLRLGKIRMVCSKRRRTLQKKGVFGCLWVNLRFNPYEYWTHTGMVLDWLYEKGYEIEFYKQENWCPFVAISIPEQDYARVLVEDENLTLQEAICEAAYQVIKGE